jgi:putative holliday junction resolvase
VVGVPVPLGGGESSQTVEVREFARQLRQALDVPVVEADERLSSHQAAAALRGRERKRTGQRDSAAAAIVLQSILDARRGPAS